MVEEGRGGGYVVFSVENTVVDMVCSCGNGWFEVV